MDPYRLEISLDGAKSKAYRRNKITPLPIWARAGPSVPDLVLDCPPRTKGHRPPLTSLPSMSINALLLIRNGTVHCDEVTRTTDPACHERTRGGHTMPQHSGNFRKSPGVRDTSGSRGMRFDCQLHSGIRSGQSTGSTGASGSSGDGGPAGGQTIPPPGALEALTGCTNPNTGVSNGDWGVGTNPVYTIVDNTAPAVGTPIYKSNAVFWTSRENAPGQSILLTGAFTDATKTARIAPIPPGTMDWQTLARGSSTVVPTTQQGTTGLSFTIPSTFSAGVYGFEIDDPSAPPILGLANVPALNWAIGVPSTTDSATALQHQVYDCGVEQGGILRLFGKNFVSSNQVVLQSSTGVPYLLQPSKMDTNSIAAPVPSDLPAGTYNVWIGTSPWSAVSSPAAQIMVHSSSSMSVRNVTCSSLDRRWRYRQYQVSSDMP